MKRFAVTAFSLVLLTILASCPTPIDHDPGIIGPEEYFWGRWVRMDGSNAEWYMASDGISIDGAEKTGVTSPTDTSFSFNNAVISKQTDNIVEVKPTTGQVYYLFRESGANAQATLGIRGTVAAQGSRPISGLGGISMVIRNLTNPGNTITPPASDSNGTVTVPGMIPGDSYVVTIPVQPGVPTQVEAPLTIGFSGQNLGYLTVGTAENFKVSASISGNPDYLLAGRQYTLNLVVRNIGTSDMLEADYAITQPVGLVLGGALQDILGSIQASGGERSLSLTVSVPTLDEYEAVFDIPIVITSTRDGTQWKDSVSIRFFKSEATIYVRSATNEVQGVLISPDHSSLAFKTVNKTVNVIVPTRSQPYILALSGADYQSETKYSVGMDQVPATNGSILTTASINEPNNSETQTTALFSTQTQLGYLGVYDLDFYSVFSMEEFEALVFDPPAGTYHADQSVALVHQSTGTIRYTTDGTMPTETSLIAPATISVDRSLTIKASVFGGAIPSTTVFSASYLLKPETPVVEVSETGYIITCATVAASIRYTLDGTDPDESSSLYTSGSVIGDSSAGIVVKGRAWYGAWDPSDIGASSGPPTVSITANSSSVNKTGTYTAVVSDDDTSEADIQVRWDWENDGTWDTSWSTTKSATHTYTSTGDKTLSVEAKDCNGVIAMTTRTVTINLHFLANFTMVTIPAGMFQIGSTASSAEQPIHTVTLSSFRMNTTEITQSQYQVVMGSNPSTFSGNTDAATCPVENASWYDALVFCNKLSMQEDLTPVYRISSSTDPAVWGTVPTSSNSTWNAAVMNTSANGYRLPTEAEWEYVARGGTTTTYYWGDSTADSTVSQYAWYTYNSNSMTHGVAQKLTNAYGLYDMSGNVWEWCWDWNGTYPSGAQTDPVGPSSGSYRVGRGGSWLDSSDYLSSANRVIYYPYYRNSIHGFRVVASVFNPSNIIHYDGNGANSGTVPSDVNTYTPGTTATVMDNSGILSKSGCIFNGWNTKAEGTGTNYQPGDTFTMGNSSITLYAKWKLNLNLTMVTIPAGTFQMGSAWNDEQPIHTVTLSAFSMSATEITQSQYEAVVGSNPSSFKTNPDAATSPVEMVNWYHAIVFCNILSGLEGKTPVYSIGGSTDPSIWGETPTTREETWDAVIMDVNATGYRLPTEAEWEYAARGGTLTDFYWGSNSDEVVRSQYTWFQYNSEDRTHSVGQKLPNPYGLFDMIGNVWEYCWDWIDTYPGEPQTNPTGPIAGRGRAYRGSCFDIYESNSQRTAYRYYWGWPPDGEHRGVGFRVVSNSM